MKAKKKGGQKKNPHFPAFSLPSSSSLLKPDHSNEQKYFFLDFCKRSISSKGTE